MLALLNLFKKKFIPAFNILSWMDEENTYSITRKAYGSHIFFPLSLIKLRSMASRLENSTLKIYKQDLFQFETIKAQVLNDGIECLSSISSILAENAFLFENR
jgi:hypothetical protein